MSLIVLLQVTLILIPSRTNASILTVSTSPVNGSSSRLPPSSLLSSSPSCTSKCPHLLSPCLRSCLNLKGGASFDSDSDLYDDFDSDSDDDFDFDFDEDDDDLFELDGDLDSMDDDFGEDNTLDRFLEAWKKTPPVTKAFLTGSAGATLLGYLTNKNEFPSYLLLQWKPTLTRLQIWRPITAFLNLGPLNFGYLMTAHFLWTYMGTLERLNHDAPYDFWVMIAFGCATMVAGYAFLKISPRFIGHNLSTFLVYVWSRYHEGLEVNMFEMFNTRAEMLPWLFLAQTFLLEGELPILDMLGIVFGHIYHHLKTTQVLRTPRFIIEWYNGNGQYSKAIRDKYKEISSDFEMQ
eukprot:CAMPEP_0184862344 /NCGR_PEP_ID=MMETSP0580-20130426/6821_1 /TAXON_ID=1118495 /ORGANISM="Dactyliosolen fragilissimus" /LENGTH=348 /DNA_ID=CAMNT_0027360171 /DNA_START=26 /DNA_END=1072 /DNA_ORIENTATION=+